MECSRKGLFGAFRKVTGQFPENVLPAFLMNCRAKPTVCAILGARLPGAGPIMLYQAGPLGQIYGLPPSMNQNLNQ